MRYQFSIMDKEQRLLGFAGETPQEQRPLSKEGGEAADPHSHMEASVSKMEGRLQDEDFRNAATEMLTKGDRPLTPNQRALQSCTTDFTGRGFDPETAASIARMLVGRTDNIQPQFADLYNNCLKQLKYTPGIWRQTTTAGRQPREYGYAYRINDDGKTVDRAVIRRRNTADGTATILEDTVERAF